MNRLVYILIVVLSFVSCHSRNRVSAMCEYDTRYSPTYAERFSINETPDSILIVRVTNPWQGAENIVNEVCLLREGQSVPKGFSGQVINIPVRKVAAMSSSFVAMFDAIGAVERVVCVSGLQFISNPAVQQAAQRGEVYDIGFDQSLDIERMKAEKCDAILMYSVSGEASPVAEKLSELKIPYIYMGDYIENNPLGKAEWLVVVAALCDKMDEGIAAFNEIAERYNSIKQTAKTISDRPKVMLNTPYRDVWFMPSVGSYAVRLIEDAGGEYIYPDNRSTSSLPISLEQAYLLASQADVWLNVGQTASLRQLRQENPRFADLRIVREGRVYNNTRRMTPAGGSDYWESGAVAPDRILRDLVQIFQNRDDSLYYYRRLE